MARPRKDRGSDVLDQDLAAPSSASSGADYVPQAHDVVLLHLAAHAQFEGCLDGYPARVTEIHDERHIDCLLDDTADIVGHGISLAQRRVPRQGTEEEGWQGATWSPFDSEP